MNTTTDDRKVSILLGIGIFCVPIIFSWFLLRKGHSTIARIIGFSWLIFNLFPVVIILTKSDSTVSANEQVVKIDDPTVGPTTIEKGTKPKPKPKPTSQPTDKDGHVSRDSFEQFGLLWPLTVNNAVIGCNFPYRWAIANNGIYGLNGVASVRAGYSEIEEIWALDVDMMKELKSVGIDDTVRISLSDMISEAGKFCGEDDELYDNR